MFYYKNIGIWYILLSLVGTTKLCSSLEDNKAIPYLSGDENVYNETQYHLSDHSQSSGDYHNVVEYIPFKHGEEEIEEYEDYRDERVAPNLINGRLGIFSWWKSEKRGKAKYSLRTTHPTVTETTCPPVIETTYHPRNETTRSFNIGTIFPLITETIFPLGIKKIDSLDSEKIFSSEIITTSPPDIETTCPPVTTFPPDIEKKFVPEMQTCTPDIETTCSPVIGNPFSLDIETIFPPKMLTTCTPGIETTCPPVIGNGFSLDIDTICTPEMLTTCTPDIETTCPPVTGNGFSLGIETICTPDAETIVPPEMLTTCTPNIETTCPPVNGNAFSLDIETIFPPKILTTCPPVVGNGLSLDSETICTPNTDTIYPPYTESICLPDTDTISSPNTEIICLPGAETTCLPPKTNTDGTAIISPGAIGASTIGDTIILSTSIDSITNNLGTMGSIANDSAITGSTVTSPEANGSNTNGPGAIGSNTKGPGVISPNSNGFGTIASTRSGPGEIGSNTNVPGRIGSNTNGPGGIGPNTNGPSGIGPNTNGPGGIGSNTNGPDGIGPNANGPGGIGPNTNGPGGIGPNTNGPGGIGSNTNGPGGIGSNTNGPGGISSKTNGPGGIGSNTNSPGAIGTNANGPGGIGSNTNGPGGIGSNTNGPGGIGSNTNGPGGIGSITNGPGGIGSTTNGPGAIGSNTNGPGAIGPNTNGPGGMGPGTDGSNKKGPGRIGFNTNGLSTVLAGTGRTARISSGTMGAASPKSTKISSTTPHVFVKNTVHTTIAADSNNIDNDGTDSSTADGDAATEAESDFFSIFDTTEPTADIRITVDPAAISTDADSSGTSTEEIDIRITVDPAAISTDPDSSDTNTEPVDKEKTVNPAALSTGSDLSDIDTDIVTTTSSQSSISDSTSSKKYLTACYTITLECSPITIGTPVICDSDEIEPTAAVSGCTTTSRTTADVLSTADSVADVEDEAVSTDASINDLTIPSVTDFIFGNVTNPATLPGPMGVQNTTAVIPPPPVLRMLGTGMILPVYQMPLTPVRASPTGPSIQPTKVSFVRIRNDRDSVLSRVRLKNNHDGQTRNINKPSLLSKRISKNKLINPLGKHPGYKRKSFIERVTQNQKNEIEGSIFQDRNPGQLIQEPEKVFQNMYNYPNPLNPLSAELSINNPNAFKKSYASLENNIQRSENNPCSDMKNYISEFVKYNDTYLSQKSNISINLVDLCKNVTCQGNNYLSQCCSRACELEKCKGEDFSYLHPIPGDTTTVTTTVKGLGPPLGTNVSYSTVRSLNNTSNSSSNSQQKNSKETRENYKNGFIKYQFMLGVTNSDDKEMMNTLKEENIRVQILHRDFPSNDRTNAIRVKSDGQLGNKRPEGVDSPYSSKNIVSDIKRVPFHEDRYRFVRNIDLQNQIDCFRENDMLLEKLKKQTAMELKKLCLLENRRKREELLFAKERENELNELKTIQELIHREFESRVQGNSAKRGVSDTEQKLVKHNEPFEKEITYTKLVKNIEKYKKNDNIDNFILNRYSSMFGIASNTEAVPVEKFPELEIKKNQKILMVTNNDF